MRRCADFADKCVVLDEKRADLAITVQHRSFEFFCLILSNDSTETRIVIYYDFGNEQKNFYFSEIEKGKEKKNIVKRNNLDIYKTLNWKGKYEGKVFLKNSMIVAYYTRNIDLEDMLQKCISSFKYK